MLRSVGGVAKHDWWRFDANKGTKALKLFAKHLNFANKINLFCPGMRPVVCRVKRQISVGPSFEDFVSGQLTDPFVEFHPTMDDPLHVAADLVAHQFSDPRRIKVHSRLIFEVALDLDKP